MRKKFSARAAADSRINGQAPRSSRAPCTASASGIDGTVAATRTWSPSARLKAPVAQQRRKRLGIRPHGACSSGQFSVTCSRSESRTNRRSSCVATR